MKLNIEGKEFQNTQKHRDFLNNKLWHAIDSQDAFAVRDLLVAGANPNGARDAHSPLLQSCAHDNTAITDMIWLAGGSLKDKDLESSSPLHQSKYEYNTDDLCVYDTETEILHSYDTLKKSDAALFDKTFGHIRRERVYPLKSKHLKALLSGEHVPTIEGLYMDHGIKFDLNTHIENCQRVYPSTSVEGASSPNVRHSKSETYPDIEALAKKIAANEVLPSELPYDITPPKSQILLEDLNKSPERIREDTHKLIG